jgi:glycosyltransferase involved in cell wall biosynthesis
LTAHNANIGKRDSRDSLFNRLTLRTQYRLADRIFVHTDAMKAELINDFSVPGSAVTVIPYGINNAVPNTGLCAPDARVRLGIESEERVILFFGAIAPYKGLDVLVNAFQRLPHEKERYRLLIAGLPKGGCQGYLRRVQESMGRHSGKITQRIAYIVDEEVEAYFQAADVLALPYRAVFQSGILFMSYSYGLPVVATRVGSFPNDVIPGETGFLCNSQDATDLALTLQQYFRSALYANLPMYRRRIRDRALSGHSWEPVAETTRDVYVELLSSSRPRKRNIGDRSVQQKSNYQ